MHNITSPVIASSTNTNSNLSQIKEKDFRKRREGEEINKYEQIQSDAELARIMTEQWAAKEKADRIAVQKEVEKQWRIKQAQIKAAKEKADREAAIVRRARQVEQERLEKIRRERYARERAEQERLNNIIWNQEIRTHEIQRKNELRTWFANAGLTQYIENFIDDGYDTLTSLRLVDSDTLNWFIDNHAHKQVFIRAIKNMKK